ncbi:YjjW family glycine radical enzyme activase [Hoeflea sp. TYP-13]|uniref:YjjW family glycine radical enzyme activase n=1 Tax=Hoeflea sp. TYP-13 TaxID=3230023 RepID=UPI0034C5EB9A
MNSLRAPISKILNWSCVDGPGNRMVLFFQGCNYNCAACHNPHTIGQCNNCGDCIPACAPQALSLVDGRISFEADLCTHCDECLKACQINANPMVQTYSVKDICALLRENISFLSGITVSGGEATLHLPFIKALFSETGKDPKLKHLSRFIDSNGHLGTTAWQSVLDVTDGFMLDIKAFDPELHMRLTGRKNDRSLASVRMLHEAGKLYELRFLMIPGRTDSETEIKSLIEFARTLDGPVRIRLNAFRTHGVRGEAAGWPPVARARVETAAGMLRHANLGPVELPALW